MKKRKTKIGKSYTREYRAWINMKTRCEQKNTPYYNLWGGRGIKMCERWKNSFESFLADMGRRPSPQHSIDRIDPDGNYEPANCRWATYKEQQRNKRARNHHVVTIGGKRMVLADAAEKSGIRYNTILYRIKRGWTPAQALRLPLRRGSRPPINLASRGNEE